MTDRLQLTKPFYKLWCPPAWQQRHSRSRLLILPLLSMCKRRKGKVKIRWWTIN